MPNVVRTLPPLEDIQPYEMPPLVDTVLPNGLRVLAVSAPSVPMVEIRLQIPIRSFYARPAVTHLLSDTLVRSTARRTLTDIDRTLGSAGASLAAGNDPRRITVSGSTPSRDLGRVLDILFEALTSPKYDDSEFTSAQHRLVEQIAVMRTQPQVLAREAMQRTCYGPSAPPLLPGADTVAAATPGEATRLHTELVVPHGSVLVLTGDIDPERVVGELAAASSTWTSGLAAAPPRSSTGLVWTPNRVEAVVREQAVQSQIALTAPAVARTDPRFDALGIANCVVGGSFSSRLVGHIREEKGLAYRIETIVDDVFDDVLLSLSADTATGATESAIDEIRKQLNRLVEEPPSEEEIDAARRFFVGIMTINMASQTGLADTLTGTIGFGLEPEWLQGFPERLRDVRRDEVTDIVDEFFAPHRFSGVVLGGSLTPGPIDFF